MLSLVRAYQEAPMKASRFFFITLATIALAIVGVLVLATMAPLSGPVHPGAAHAQSAPAPDKPLRPLTSSLVISEVYDSAEPAYEYFELYNASNTFTFNLGAFAIYNRDGSNSLANLTSTLALLPPRQ